MNPHCPSSGGESALGVYTGQPAPSALAATPSVLSITSPGMQGKPVFSKAYEQECQEHLRAGRAHRRWVKVSTVEPLGGPPLTL